MRAKNLSDVFIYKKIPALDIAKAGEKVIFYVPLFI